MDDKLFKFQDVVNKNAHHCHWPGCTKEVPPKLWGCKEHWLKLPKHFRDLVWLHYVPGQEKRKDPSRAYCELALEIQKWIREHS